MNTQRWCDFQWKPIRWIAVNSKYESTEALFAACMKILDDVAVPLVFLGNRYQSAPEVICLDLPVRYGVAMSFIRAQAKATEQQLAGLEPGNEEKEARDAWLASGLSADEYRSFALQVFQIRQERDPPFVFVVFRGSPEKWAVMWFRDIHLASNIFCKGAFPSSVEHLYWPNYSHRQDVDPPMELCERPECGKCGGLVTDARLLLTFQKHAGPWRTASKDAVNVAMKQLWTSKYQVGGVVHSWNILSFAARGPMGQVTFTI